jgi:hypothetical protein
MEEHVRLKASLCSDYGELTDRQPCRVIGRDVELSAKFSADEGVADRLVLWCADCGKYVAERPLRQLVVFSEGVITVFALPLVPMHCGDRGEA